MSKYKKFAVNEIGRDFVCSDIHGHFELLDKKLIEVQFNPNSDRLFSLGDLIDRGPNSNDAPNYMGEPWFHPVMGNHEAMACKALSNLEDSQAAYLWLMNGGQWIQEENVEYRLSINEALSSLPLIIEIELKSGKNVGLIHAEAPLMDWNDLVEKVKAYPPTSYDGDRIFELLIWARTKINDGSEYVVKGIDHIYHGHSILNKPVTLGNCTYMDMGSFHTGKIGFIELK